MKRSLVKMMSNKN